MTDPEPPALDADVRALLRRASGIDPAPGAAKIRVRARVESCIAAGGGGAAGPGANEDGVGAGVPAGVAPVVPRVVQSTGLARRLLPLALSFAVGGGVGGLVVSRIRRPADAGPATATRVIDIDRPVDVGSAGQRAEGLTPANPSERPVGAVASERPQRLPSALHHPLNAERRLLDVARGALERGEPAVALDATTKHQRLFPGGVLVQEREAMAIRALAMLGRFTEARARAARFRVRFPDSILWPAIESAVGPATGP